MDGIHDMGGMHGFGPVRPDSDERPWREAWEGRVHGTVLAAAVAGAGLPYGRAYIERLDPVTYLTASYYEKWLIAAEQRAVDAGLVTAAELAERQRSDAPMPVTSDPALARRCRTVLQPFPVRDPDGPPHRFAVGDSVRARRMRPEGHCRSPRYIRGVVGTVLAHRTAQNVLDAVADGEFVVEPQYSVRFESHDLWGAGAEPNSCVVVDLWERHLEAP